MFSILKVPSEKIKDKLISDVKERVTSIKAILSKEVEFEDVCNALTVGFQRSLDVDIKEGELNENEINLASEIKRDRYSNPQWNHRR
jgi:lipoate-protein ligase A